MIKSIKITNHLGESITLSLRSPEQSGFFIRRVDGLGPSKVNINTVDILGLDGALFNSSRVEKRNLVFDLGFYDSTLSAEEIRQLSYKYFPLKRELEFLIETDNRTAKTTGFVEANEPNIFSKQEGTIISILCPNAYFLSEEIILTLFSGIQNNFEFPFENPSIVSPLIEFSSLLQDTRQTVYYDGDAQVGITIYIHFVGSANDLTIYDITTNQVMAIDSDKLIDLTGSDFVAGDDVFISTSKGNKYIYLLRNGVLYNILNTVGVDADWFLLDKGDNVFDFTAVSGLSNIQLAIEHNILYEGL